jgi:hypothetical protein
MEKQYQYTNIIICNDGFGGLLDNIIMSCGVEGFQVAAPAPVGDDERLADAIELFGEG